LKIFKIFIRELFIFLDFSRALFKGFDISFKKLVIYHSYYYPSSPKGRRDERGKKEIS
jgi:hypothetical protein